MLAIISDIRYALDKIAPEKLAMSWDNVGLLIGDSNRHIKKILLALDVTEAVIDEAIKKGCDLIITHHPLIFGAIKKITSENSQGRKIIRIIENKISLISAHTNLDIVSGGINDSLAAELGLCNIEVLEVLADSFGIGRVGCFKQELECIDVINKLKEMLKLDIVTVYGCCEKKISKVSICSGSGMKYADAAVKNKSDLYITSDITYHDAQDAIEAGLTLIDVTHYAGENIFLNTLSEKLNIILRENCFDTDVLITETNGQIKKYI